MTPERLGSAVCPASHTPPYNRIVATPVAALTFLGILIVVLGLFVAGNLTVVVVGLGAICTAGVLDVLGRRRIT